MTLLYLVRHAWPVVTPAEPPDAWPLAHEGAAAARSMGRSLRGEGIVAVRSSAEGKAVDTARLIAGPLGVPTSIDPDLGEVRGRAFAQDDYEARVARLFEQPETSPDGWEPAADAQRRFAGAVEAFRSTLAGGNGLIVAHGLVLALYLAHLRGESCARLDDWRAIRLPDLAIVDPVERRSLRPFGAPTPYHG